eukprot:scaffold294512_cov25-Prasinocladus_malaysianus.AAC.1
MTWVYHVGMNRLNLPLDAAFDGRFIVLDCIQSATKLRWVLPGVWVLGRPRRGSRPERRRRTLSGRCSMACCPMDIQPDRDIHEDPHGT